jgi:hypothetical protein
MRFSCRASWILGLALSAGATLLVAASVAADPADTAAQPQSKTAVDLFDAMKSGQVDVKYIPRDSREGQLLVTNKTDQPLTVKLPDAFAAIPVLAQAAAGAGGNGNRKSYNNSNGGQNQGVGGGGGMGMGGGGGQMGGGAFDVAPEKVAKIKVETVCLEHGKKEPTARVPYELVPIESFTSDARVQELCKLLGTGKIDQRAAQAAAWHLANGMSWEDLLNKKIHHLIGGDEAYFSETEILDAMKITDQALKLADARPANLSAAPSSSTTATSNGRN